MTFTLRRPSGRVVLKAASLPALIAETERLYGQWGRTWLGLMAAGWRYSPSPNSQLSREQLASGSDLVRPGALFAREPA